MLRIVVEAALHLLTGKGVEGEDTVVALQYFLREYVVAVLRLDGVEALQQVGVGQEGDELIWKFCLGFSETDELF